MKKTLITMSIIFFVSICDLYSQDIIDPPKIFIKDTLSIIDNRPNSFIIGWNWGNEGRKLDQALFINTYHSFVTVNNPPEVTQQIGDSIKAISVLIDETTITNKKHLMGRSDNQILNGMSLFVEPTLAVNTTDNFKMRNIDVSGGVYGFKYHGWNYGDTTSTGNDFSRFLLYADRVSNSPVTILDSVFDGSILRQENYVSTNDFITINKVLRNDSINTQEDERLFHNFNGKQWYLSMNLRALNKDDVANHLNDTILSIELPYTLKDITDQWNPTFSYGTIRFDSIPDTNTTKNIRIVGTQNNDYRGVYRALTASSNQPTVIYITGKMLKVQTNNQDSNSITLSAFFKTTGYQQGSNYQNNPTFKYDFWENLLLITKYIDTINIRVKYYGKLDIGIDWFKIETPRARQIYFGYWDTLVYRSLQSSISTLRRSSVRNPLLYRIYGADEFLPHQWGVQRYYNMLLDTIVASEIYIDGSGNSDNPPRRMLLATNFKEYWTGSTPYHYRFNSPATPYFKLTELPWLLGPKLETFNVWGGYAGNNFTINQIQPYLFSDTLNSEYETFLIHANWSAPIDSPSYKVSLPLTGTDTLLFDKYYGYSPDYYPGYSTQEIIEGVLRNNYFKFNNLIYNVTPWWANLWINGEMSYDTKKMQSMQFSIRPKTGEEIRLMTNIPIILGAKGLIYYQKGFPRNLVTTGGSCAGLLNSWDDTFLNSLPDGLALIYSNINGGDYINPNENTYYHFQNALKSYVHEWDTLGTTIDRIYLGVKSTTAELYKINSWIKAVNQSIMNMKLASWYGKGFLTMYSQDAQYGSDSILTKFISLDTNRLFTKKIWNPETFTKQYQKESYDSTFFDLCIHKLKNVGMDTVFFVAVTNRRTDPLIHPCDTIKANPIYIKPKTDNGMLTTGDVIDCGVKFYSTAEYDSAVRYGGYIIDKTGTYPLMSSQLYRDTTYWREQFWKRFGCREIHIPFKYRYTTKADNYTLLHITELGKGTPLDTNWWFRAPYRHVIDTVIQRDSTLIVKLLPGEGKILKVEVMYSPNDEPFLGDLSYSNQRKIVAYPIHQTSSSQIPNPDDTIRYHAVYFKQIPNDPSGRLGVYYRRSRPMPSNYAVNQIDWEPINYLLSDSIIVRNQFGNFDTLKTNDCAYPAITVRYDSLSVPNKIKVYVVYSAKDLFAASNMIHIIENVFDAEGVLLPSIKYGRVIATCHADGDSKIIRWGTPAINASYNGNYYAWSDSSVGIVAGFKLPNQYDLATKDTLHFIEPPLQQIARHPSLNTYSRLYSSETDCALVWQEKDKDSSENYYNIQYARLRLDPSGRLIHYVPKRGCTANYPFFARYKFPDSSMVLLTNAGLPNQYYYNKYMYPMIYRGIEVGSQCCYDNINTCHGDMVFWQGRDELNTDVIWIAGIQLLDTINAFTGEWMPDCWDLSCLSSIRSSDPTRRTSLFRPDAAQGCLRAVPPGEYNNKGDSLMVTNFVQMPDGQDVNPNGRIWQVISGYWGFFNDWQTLRGEFTDYKYARRIASKGQNPHLAALPMINNDSIWNRNRRIFEVQQYPENTNRIVTSLEWFYRNDGDETSSEPFFGYVHDSLKTMFSYPYMLDADGEVSRPFIKPFELIGNTRMPLDTIYSDWFGVGDIKQMKIFGFSKNTELMSVYIQRMKDNKTFKLNTPIIGSKYVRNNYQLYNGGKHQYRLIFVKNIPDMSYTEDLVIGGFPDAKDFSDAVDSRFGRAVQKPSMQYVDLGEAPTAIDGKNISLLAYPNPADDYIVATAYISYNELMSKQHKLLIKVVSVLGMELYRQEVKPGETIMLDTKDYLQGAYFIRAEEKTGNYLDDRLTPAIQGFVIKR